MDALQGYGSSGEETLNDDDLKIENKKQNFSEGVIDHDNLPSIRIPSSTLAVQICAAPEVVSTVGLQFYWFSNHKSFHRQID